MNSTPELDNAEYGAVLATVDGHTVRFRVGKITPKKLGLFVAVWRRADSGATEPFPSDDPVDALVIAVREENNFGAFMFPRSAPIEHGIVAENGVGGKRGFRVYPPWSDVSNVQSRRSREWQCHYFLAAGEQASADWLRAT